MESTKKYYKYLDILRIVSCIAVFLYHLGILKGGYLAVCSFFVLSGYLSYLSAFKKDKFSFKEYYKDRFFHIYLPFAIVILVSVGVISLIPSINWLNLKPETTSALLGYNNFWQLNANLDYFTRHIDSPFMHFWYMGILLQFEIVFPFFFLLFRKIGDKKKLIPCILLGILTILGTGYFVYMCVSESNRMIVYYHTLTRVFSLILGMFIGAVHSYYHSFTIKKVDARVLFAFYSVLLILACFFIDAESPYFMLAMILVSVFTGRLVSYGTSISQDTLSKTDKILKYFAKISYEIYLFQYPVIYLFQFITFSIFLKDAVIVLITLLLSMGLHFALEKNLKEKKLILQILMIGLFTLTTSYGLYRFILAEDHTAEMKQLEEQLNQNEKMMANKQEEYAKRLKEEEEQLEAALREIETSTAGLDAYIHSLPVIGVGDSVMLGAFSSLYQQFPNGYFDAKVSRTDYEANRILQSIKYQGFLGEPIVIGLGTNGQCGASCQYEILRTTEKRKVFWINVVNDAEVHVNAGLSRLANDNPNVTLIDWASASIGHPEYFVADGIHLTGSGREAYAKTVYNAIYQVYQQDIQAKKEQILKEHEDNLNKKVSFYGNDVLLKAYDALQTEFQGYEVDFHAKQEQASEDILKEIKEASKSNSFPKHVVFLLDASLELTKEQLQELHNLPTHVYLVTMKNLPYMDTETITIFDFSKEIESHAEYLMVDRIHLTEIGNEALAKQLLEIMNAKQKVD